jgi:hypothetical protein
MVLILLNILVLFGLFASNNFGRDLLNTVSGSFSRIPQDTHQGSDVARDDQSHTMVETVELVREGGPEMGGPEMECSHTQVKPTAKRDGSASPSIEVKAVAIR